MTAVHQLLPVLSPGDAIGGATLRMREMLHALGFSSSIFAGLIDPQYRHVAQSADELAEHVDDGDAVLYHLSIGSAVASVFEKIAAKRIIVFHNVTPERYFRETNPVVEYWARRGRDDLEYLAPLADLVLAPSEFNAREVRDAGARECLVLPLAIDLQRLSPRASRGSQPPRILFVGRAAPNKRHDVLIRALAALRGTANSDAQVVMVGVPDDNEAYVESLRDLARLLGVDGAVAIEARRVSDAELGEHYARADILATASEHEGFCVPLIEAMSFSVPVVAYNAGAIPETAGGAALLLDNHDPLVWAGAWERLLCDRDLRTRLIGAGRLRAAMFDNVRLQRDLGRALADAGIHA